MYVEGRVLLARAPSLLLELFCYLMCFHSDDSSLHCNQFTISLMYSNHPLNNLIGKITTIAGQYLSYDLIQCEHTLIWAMLMILCCYFYLHMSFFFPEKSPHSRATRAD